MKSQDAYANVADEIEVKELICNSIDNLIRQQPKTKPKNLPTSCELGSCKSNLDVALCYASVGWSVFPIRSTLLYKKSLAMRNGTGDATTDPQLINDWWSDHPNAQVGIPTGPGSGLLVIDHTINSDGTGTGELRQLLKKTGVEIKKRPNSQNTNRLLLYI